MLSPDERNAANDYVGGHYKLLNEGLRNNETLSPKMAELHKNMQEAFKKSKPLPNPIRVNRGMKFKELADLNAYLQPFKNAAGTDTLVPLVGYISTGTVGTPGRFQGQIEFTIIARQGLDMTLYTSKSDAMAEEKELLLNHGTLVKVHRVKAMKAGSWHVYAEQILV